MKLRSTPSVAPLMSVVPTPPSALPVSGVLQRGHARVERLEGFVERIGAGGARRDGGIVRARHRVVAGVVHHLRRAILLDGLHELGRDQTVGRLAPADDMFKNCWPTKKATSMNRTTDMMVVLGLGCWNCDCLFAVP